MNYRIVADSGSTKTDWVVLDDDQKVVQKIKSIGFNPYFQTPEFIFTEVRRAFDEATFDKDAVAEVNFYGAGCSSEEKNETIRTPLKQLFSHADVNVNHDLVAAARACLGDANGIAGILGTGSNSCVWHDGKVIANVPSHGYIFGDEGSGSYLGIELAKLYLEDRLSPELRASFENEFKLTEEQIINTTYREKDPNVFLARFASFYEPHLHNESLRNIVKQGFKAFFEKRVVAYENYQNYELGFIGSIAFYYQEVLREVASEYGMNIRKISQCPIDELVNYHIECETQKVM